MQQTHAHSPGRGRDSFIDVIRALCVLAVISQHWLMPVLAYENGHLSTGNALASPGWWIVTWLTQVMPMVFFMRRRRQFLLVPICEIGEHLAPEQNRAAPGAGRPPCSRVAVAAPRVDRRGAAGAAGADGGQDSLPTALVPRRLCARGGAHPGDVQVVPPVRLACDRSPRRLCPARRCAPLRVQPRDRFPERPVRLAGGPPVRVPLRRRRPAHAERMGVVGSGRGRLRTHRGRRVLRPLPGVHDRDARGPGLQHEPADRVDDVADHRPARTLAYAQWR